MKVLIWITVIFFSAVAAMVALGAAFVFIGWLRSRRFARSGAGQALAAKWLPEMDDQWLAEALAELRTKGEGQ